MSARSAKDVRLVYGASPRVHLLPPEVADRKRGAALRRSIVLGVVGALVLSAGAYTFASWRAIEAASAYDAARADTAVLLEQQNKYAEVRTLGAELATVTDARQTGALTEVDWNAFYARVAPTLPAGVEIISFNIASSTPTVELPATTTPWQTPKTATVDFVVTAPDLAAAQAWAVALKNLPEYGGALVSSISRAEGSVLTVNVTLDVTTAALTNRFQPVVEETPDAAEEGEN